MYSEAIVSQVKKLARKRRWDKSDAQWVIMHVTHPLGFHAAFDRIVGRNGTVGRMRQMFYDAIARYELTRPVCNYHNDTSDFRFWARLQDKNTVRNYLWATTGSFDMPKLTHGVPKGA